MRFIYVFNIYIFLAIKENSRVLTVLGKFCWECVRSNITVRTAICSPDISPLRLVRSSPCGMMYEKRTLIHFLDNISDKYVNKKVLPVIYIGKCD